jgi:hypothetical protein
MSLQGHIRQSRIEHVIQRARERYELELTPKDVEYIEFRMFYSSDPLIRPLFKYGPAYLYAVRVKGQWVVFVFDMIDRQAVTVYPAQRLNGYRKVLDEVKKQFKEKYASMPDHPLWVEINKQELEYKFPLTSERVWKDKVS